MRIFRVYLTIKVKCYKLFWFQAIVSRIMQGRAVFTYEKLIHEMIADAWYMVTEYHLNLDPNDTLEKKEALLEYLENCTDRTVMGMKRTLARNVPYRLQAPFMDSMRGDEWKRTEENLAKRINQEKRLMYYFQAFEGLQTKIELQPDWLFYIQQNREIIQGWIELNMITYILS